MSKQLTMVLLALCAALTVGCGDSETADARAPKPFFGITPQVPSTDADFARMAAGQVGSYHVFLNWSVIEKQAGVYDWSKFDSLFGKLAENDMIPITYVYGTPAYLAGPASTPPTDSPEALQAYKNFLTAAAARYEPGGDFWDTFVLTDPGVEPKPAEIWEIWNEVNGPAFWSPRPSPGAYAKLLRASAKILHSRDPDLQVMTAGMFATPSSNKAITSFKFLRKLYKKPGVSEATDFVGIHPYGPGIKDVKNQVAKTYREMKRGGDGGDGMWVTELGWGSDATANSRLAKNPRQQAKLLRQAYTLLLDNQSRWNIEGALWYSWRDTNTQVTACTWCPSSGLFDVDLDSKPSWLAFTKLTGGTP